MCGWVLKVQITTSLWGWHATICIIVSDQCSFSCPNSINVIYNFQHQWCEYFWSSTAFRQTGDYTYNRLYLTLIHSCVCFSDPLTRTYSTLRVFRVDIFLPAPSSHQSTTPTMLFAAILRVPKEDKTRHLTDGKLFPPVLELCVKDLWLNSYPRGLDIRHCHRVRLSV